jgi:hypothetical protein
VKTVFGRSTALALAGFLAIATVVVVACSDGSEGDRCETANANDDCGPGLICVEHTRINPPYNTSDRCCPADQTTATHPACIVGTGIGAANDGGGFTDALPSDGAGTDTGVDTGTDTGTADAADAADAD